MFLSNCPALRPHSILSLPHGTYFPIYCLRTHSFLARRPLFPSLEQPTFIFHWEKNVNQGRAVSCTMWKSSRRNLFQDTFHPLRSRWVVSSATRRSPVKHGPLTKWNACTVSQYHDAMDGSKRNSRKDKPLDPGTRLVVAPGARRWKVRIQSGGSRIPIVRGISSPFFSWKD